MNRFFSSRHEGLAPYVPGEQPRDGVSYIKLNTNESPFAPSPAVSEALRGLAGEDAAPLRLYPDPDVTALREAVAREINAECGASLGAGNVLPVNGSDEALSFAFLAFGGEDRPFAFADISYGFYPVYARLYGIPYREIPLREDFSLAPEDYLLPGYNIVIANPNAPTGIALSPARLESVIAAHPDRAVIIDEAYVDFGAESCAPLIAKYPNLLVVRTFSKSRNLAGARLGFALGGDEIISALRTVKYSVNPYNVSRMAAAVGIAAMGDRGYFDRCRAGIIAARSETSSRLRALGFTLTNSSANFIFAAHPDIPGAVLCAALRRRGILVRRFDLPRIADRLRITVGSPEQMTALADALAEETAR